MAGNASVAPGQTLDRTLQVDTLELGFEIADLGSRFLALLVDSAIIGAAMIGLTFLSFWAGTQLELSERAVGWAGLLVVLGLFTVFWGYFTYFEGFRGGRTPGKRWVGIRVVHEGSHPLTLRGAAIRNLVRIVDAQPVMSWMVGGLTMMVHPRTQRLGDLAAATLVVRDRGDLELSEAEMERLTRHSSTPPEMPDPVFAALEQFAERRSELSPDVRARLSRELQEALSEPLAARRSELTGDGENRLMTLYREERDRRGGAGLAEGLSSPLVGSLVRSRGPDWVEYHRLLERADAKGLASLAHDELERFAALYRSVAADLARARTYGAPAPLAFTLERWVGNGHNLLYRRTGRSWAALVEWLRAGFPTRVRARRGFVAAAAACFLLPGLAAYGAIRIEPSLARDLLPETAIARAETARERAAEGAGYVDVPDVFMPIFSSRIITNNVQVSFMAFAAGITAGIGTVLLLVFNGLHIGGVLGLFRNEGALPVILEFVAPHGVMEILAICIAGAAGLILGSGLVAPGRLTRTAALARRGREAVSLLAGTTLLLVLSGFIEGFVSPAPVPTGWKLTIAASAAAAVVAYLLFAGRGEAVTADPDT